MIGVAFAVALLTVSLPALRNLSNDAVVAT
jgi:hypothetical protein